MLEEVLQKIRRPTMNDIIKKNNHISAIDFIVDDLVENNYIEIEDEARDFLQMKIEYNDYHDGFELSKDMDNEIMLCNPDHEFVEILERVSYEMSSILKNEIKTWVKENNIQPKLKENDNVSFFDPIDDENKEGYITYINYEEAQYCVAIPSEGHVGSNSSQTGTIGKLINFEELENKN